MRTILTALLLLVAAQSQGPRRDAGTTVAKPAGTGVIRGRVIAADTRVPIRRAIVAIYGGTTSQAIYSDALGRYEVRNLAPGSYWVRAEPNWYQGQFLPSVIPPSPSGDGPPRFAVADGQIVEAGDLLLPRAGVIVGRVVDENGDPVGNIRVGALRADSRGVDSYQSQNSDEFGRYRLFHLTPGEYVIVVTPSSGGDFLPLGRGQSLGFVETYYPGTYSRAEARRVRVRAGQETAAGDFQITRARMLNVKGIVLDSHGTPPASRTMIALNRKDGTGGRSTGVDAQGRFFFQSQQPGAYQVTARTQDESGENTLEYAGATLTLVDMDLDDVVVSMKPTVSLAGRVVFETAPAPAMTADALTIGAQMKDRSMPSEVAVRPAAVAADLTFTLRRLAGELIVRPNGPNNWVLKAVLLGNRDITDVPTEFRAEDSGRLQVVLTTRASELSGSVTNDKGEPIASCSVVLFSEDKASWFQSSLRFRLAYTGRDGRFDIKGLRSGRYYLIALPRERAPSFQSVDAAALEPLVKDATALVLGEDEQRVVDLKVTNPGGGH
jgi:hypothetical protein